MANLLAMRKEALQSNRHACYNKEMQTFQAINRTAQIQEQPLWNPQILHKGEITLIIQAKPLKLFS